MRFHVVGADKETGNDVELDIVASDRAEAEGMATKRGLMVSAVEPISDPDPEEIELAAPDPRHKSGQHKAVAHAPAKNDAPPESAVDPSVAMAMKSGSLAGKSVAGASAAGASAAGASAHGSITGAVGGSTSQPGAHMEYHVIMNQSLYLLEVAVNKHLKDGWEPQGGIVVGISNNALQYFQAMIRHKD
jgi:hypothetical protein